MERISTKDDVLPLRYPIVDADGHKHFHISINAGQVTDSQDYRVIHHILTLLDFLDCDLPCPLHQQVRLRLGRRSDI